MQNFDNQMPDGLLSMVTTPCFCSMRPNMGRIYLLEKSADSSVRNMTLPMNQPALKSQNLFRLDLNKY